MNEDHYIGFTGRMLSDESRDLHIDYELKVSNYTQAEEIGKK